MATSESTPLLVPLGGESSASPQDPPPSPKQSISTSTQDGNNVGSVNVVPVLMELIGGRDLPIAINADVMDTYCVVQFGTQTIHRTMPFAPKVSSVERVSRAFRLSDDGNSGCSPTNGDGGGTTGRQKRRTRLERDVENPIWTVHHDSMFVCAINTPRDVDNHKAVVVSVWTRPRPKTLQDRALRAVASPIVQGRRAVAPPSPRIGGGGGPDATRGGATQQQRQPRFVGKIRIPAPDVLHRYCRSVGGRDDRVELPLVDDIGRAVTNEDGVPATLSFRCRVASDADISFVRNVALVRKNLCGDSNSLMRLAHSDGTEVTSLRVLFEQADVITEPNRPRASLITEVPEFEIQGSSFSAALSGSVIPTLLEPGKVKVKPYPDPHRVSKNGSNVIAHYMSPREVKAQTGLPSRSWVQAGTLSTSSFGRVYIEVLSCHDLPNVDIGEAVGNQTDAFVSIIYADAMVETDVIDDELSPHFPPWSQRAFCFPIHHPNQVIYLAVFGFKRSPLQHRRIGRVEINPIHFQHNTVYDLRYALAASSHSAARTSNGVVRVRIRMEVDNERGYLLASLKPPPPVYINVKRKKSLIVARFTARGEYDNDERFQLSVLQGYIDEIVEGYVRRLLYSVQDGLRSLVLWRNQVFLFNGRIGFPIYSLLIFVLSLLAVISPRLIPGILCLEFALLMLVQMQHRINDPSPLRRCFRFGYYFRVLIGGKTVPPAFDKLEENSGLEELQALQKAQEARAERDREFFDKKDEVEKLIEELEHEFIETKSKGMIPLEIMAVLGKLQGAVGNVCRACRFIDTILTWEESSLSFFLTLALLVGGSLLLLLPWAFILKWVGLLFTVVFLGPQNKILDLLYFRHQPTDDQRLMKLFSQKLYEARMYQEENRKVKSFRHLLFGKYSTAVPTIMWTPHKDFPLPNSSARYYGSSYVLPGAIDVEKLPLVPGQKLYGSMIPRPEDAWKRNVESSLLTRAAYEKSLRKQHDDKEPVDSVEDENNEAALGGVDEGFEVVEIYDEELGFVKNSLQPPRRESINELGVEILDNSDRSLRFVPAFRSVHDFEYDDDSDSKSSENDRSPDDALSIRISEASPTDCQSSRLESNANENDGQPYDGRKTSSAFLSERRASGCGIEITESFVDEALFVQQSWRGLSTASMLEQANDSRNNVRKPLDGDINLKPPRIEGWSHQDDDLMWRTESPLDHTEAAENRQESGKKDDQTESLGPTTGGISTNISMKSSQAFPFPPNTSHLSLIGIGTVQPPGSELPDTAIDNGGASTRVIDKGPIEILPKRHVLELSRNEAWDLRGVVSDSVVSDSNIADYATPTQKCSRTSKGTSPPAGLPESLVERAHFEATVRMASVEENGFEVVDS